MAHGFQEGFCGLNGSCALKHPTLNHRIINFRLLANLPGNKRISFSINWIAWLEMKSGWKLLSRLSDRRAFWKRLHFLLICSQVFQSEKAIKHRRTFTNLNSFSFKGTFRFVSIRRTRKTKNFLAPVILNAMIFTILYWKCNRRVQFLSSWT